MVETKAAQKYKKNLREEPSKKNEKIMLKIQIIPMIPRKILMDKVQMKVVV